ncbi:hypothetical protein LUZ60_009875 [Juncus effusus]|nr:hypothetical protein LUZ60_009875 [Juncus effusus]
METTIFSIKSSLFHKNSPIHTKLKQLHTLTPHLPNRSLAKRLAAKRDIYGGDYGGALVDNNMSALRKRIHEMKMIETKFEEANKWMDWERKYYENYCSDVCNFVGVIQIVLLNVRPSFAILMFMLIMCSVPASVLVLLHYLGDVFL